MESSSDSDSDIALVESIPGSRATPISSSDSDIPQAKITHGSRTAPIPTSNRKQPTLTKLASVGGNLFRKNTNRKNGESYFNPFKEAIVDYSDHTVTLQIGHILAGRGNHRLPRSQPAPTLRRRRRVEHDWRKPDAHTNEHKFVDRSYRYSGFPSEIVSRQQSSWTIILGSTLEPKVLDSTPEETHPVATQPRFTFRPPAFLC